MSLADLLAALPRQLGAESLLGVMDAVVAAREKGKPVVVAMGAHVIKCGLQPVLKSLMEADVITAFALNGAGSIHDYAELVAASLGFSFEQVELDGKRPFLGHRPGDEEATAGLFRADRKNIIMVPETSIAYKNYPKEKLVQVANRLRQNILVCHGSPAELESARYLAEHSPYVTVLPCLNLNQLKAVISRADLVIGGDTGPTHMAWACNVPSLALFGATSIPYGMGQRHRALTSGSVVNRRRPDKRDFSIGQIVVDEIISQAEELLVMGNDEKSRE